MKARLGMVVVSEYGQGPILAMTREWCVHSDHDGDEYAVNWEDVSIPVHRPDAPASTLQEGPEVKHGQ